MTKQEQIIYKIARAVKTNASPDYIDGLLEMASIALELTEQTIYGMVEEKLA